ncbi:MAG: acetyl-CoA carboxylase carboxyltransferase subunit alpha [Chitinophagales bacterium]|nr:acetyl-CoA carboxylase carboxyltransferase subunit alpha [Chitinophagales bacterium]MCO5279532.1 acetyl-CoA carboxylase carboxyltransferase subunit alpha [Chitinophagales bacterium]OJV24244.1 MAG: acetyl-CoA carboxylase carboxyltransferase subunit alpha [Bacteroidetes bacterium 37-13]HRN93531.1 acetyl-CoA carboxylase carboxyltransferase subunit alpha [Chitinophagales bacterium]
MTFLDFESPIAALVEEREKLKQIELRSGVSMSDKTSEIETKIKEKQKELYSNLTTWQRIQVSRHPERPYSLFYIEFVCDSFIELFGDRHFKDDKAMVGGFGSLNGETVMFIGNQKGVNTKMRQYRNFGMANPEGYRKALRLMKLAEKFNKPIVTLIDTPGAFPGEEAEQRGQGEAIARNLFEMVNLKVPVLCIVIGEGASGGALGIGIGDKLLMLENTWYSVISPESCSSILWRSWEHKEKAANALKPTPNDLFKYKIIDGIVKEPCGGAHSNPQEMAKTLKKTIHKYLEELKAQTPEERIENRINKFSKIGVYETLQTKEEIQG